VYDASTEYRPEILKTDVGCGISAGFIAELNYTPKEITSILKAVDEMQVHIGQGNHFLDFTTAHPKTQEGKVRTNMIFLHSDFNNGNIIPTSYEQARQMEIEAAEKRRDYLEKLIRKLGIPGGFYQDWTHNSVAWENEKFIYRKGSINIAKTEEEGLLALNPFEGLYLYVSDWKRYCSSMQHATGKQIDGIKCDRSGYEIIRQGIARGMVIGDKLPADLHSEYQPKEYFQNTFLFEHKPLGRENPLGCCVPKLVVKTKI
jgi:hypothetical protein